VSKKIASGRKVPGSKPGLPLIYCRSKVSLGRVGSGPISTIYLLFNVVEIEEAFLDLPTINVLKFLENQDVDIFAAKLDFFFYIFLMMEKPNNCCYCF